MSWGQSTFTNAGSEMFVETISGQKMLLASAKGGAGTSTAEELKTATAVKDEKQTLALLEEAGDGLMFDGEPLDEETRQLLRASLENQLEMTKRLAKQKFTPKKYRKD